MSNKNISRRGFFAAGGAAALAAAMGGALTGCGDNGAKKAAETATGKSWEEIVAAAKGQTVTWYGWGGSDPRNEWIDKTVAPVVKEKYDITIDRVPMDINDILTQLSGDKEAGAAEGTIDMIWINGENFFTSKENGYIYGPFATDCPNYQQFVDGEAADIIYDFGSAVEGYEAPYGKAQMVMWCDTAVVKDLPTTPEKFLEFVKANPGKVTYPEPGDFTGTAFIMCLIAGVVGKENFEKLATFTAADATPEKIKEIIEPGLEYLRSLNPYLWKKGASFPADSPTVGTMYADGELIMNMGYGDPQVDVDNGTLPKTTKSFVFETGTVGNTNFLAIGFNSVHTEGAMVVINEVMSPEVQLTQYSDLGTITVLDSTKFDDATKKAFADVELGSAQLSVDELLAVRTAEASGPCVPVIEKIWHEEVAGK